MTIYDQAVQITSRLTLNDKVRLLAHLSTALQQDLTLEAYKHIPWEQFLNITYGSLAHDPIERNQPVYPDTRDDIE